MTDTSGSGDAGQAAATAAAAAAAAGNQQQTEAPWYGKVEDNDLKGWIENKGFKAPIDALASYRSLEKVFGADKAGRTVVLPGDTADQSERDAFYAKLGRPDTPDKYDLEVPADADKTLVDWFKNTMHKHGMPQGAAKEFLKDYNALTTARLEADQTAADNKLAEEHASLDKEWGAAKPQKLEQAKAAARQFGFTQEDIDAIEKTVGYSGVMKRFADIGAKLGEGGQILPDNGNPPFGGVMTPAAAQAKMAELKNDQQWVTRWMAGGPAEVKQWDDLNKWASAK